MKRLSIIYCLAFISTLCYCQYNADWIVLNNGDTIYCKVWSRGNGSLLSRPKVTVDTGDGRYLNYTSYDILSIQHGDTIFWSVPHRPWRKGGNKRVWSMVLMKNGGHHILKYENVINSELGPQYELMYYHFEGRIFKAEITNGNYRQIITEHFSDCPYIRELLSEKKNFFRNDRISDVAEKYRERCQEDR